MLEKQLEYIREITDFSPEILIVLGSGLGNICDNAEIVKTIDFRDIPDFPVSTAPTHKGRFVFARISGKNVAIMQGRVHLYEGYLPQEVVMPLRLIRMLGAKILFLTNAAGGINKSFKPGDLMIIEDHISCFVPSPLIGKNDEAIGPRFPDMSEVYSKRLNSIIKECADEIELDIKSGVYIQLNGPSFETPAEIRMLKTLGGDAVGMSTVIEAIAAKHCGYEICAVSNISNLASGITDNPITSEEVTLAGINAAPIFSELIKNAIGKF